MKLSIVIPTKNDEQNRYLGTVLDQMKGLPVEILVVDWGSAPPLEVRHPVRLLRVPPDVSARYDRDSYFAYIIATNVGVRRATGEFISFFGNDTFIDAPFLQWLDGARSGCLYFIGRKNISSIDDVTTVKVSRMTPELHASAGQVAHRDVWNALRGYSERLVYFGWMEHELRERAQLLGIRPRVVYEVSAYHFTHPRPRMRRRGRINERVLPDNILHPTVPVVNGENWGLVDEPIYEDAPVSR